MRCNFYASSMAIRREWQTYAFGRESAQARRARRKVTLSEGMRDKASESKAYGCGKKTDRTEEAVRDSSVVRSGAITRGLSSTESFVPQLELMSTGANKYEICRRGCKSLSTNSSCRFLFCSHSTCCRACLSMICIVHAPEMVGRQYAHLFSTLLALKGKDKTDLSAPNRTRCCDFAEECVQSRREQREGCLCA